MQFETFLLERNQTLFENDVEFNLTESGVHPYRLREILSRAELENLVDTPLGYGFTEGRPGLRRAIATWYPGADAENVGVVHGTSEANMLAILTLCSPGDEILFVLPNFMQIQGLARALGIGVRTLALTEENDWQVDIDVLRGTIGPNTRMIAFANPSNPTGQVFNEASMQALIEVAAEANAYLLSDEIYRGAEVGDFRTQTFWKQYDRVVVTCSLSKSFANPGLRLGWIVAPHDVIQEVMRRQDYTSIGTGTLSQIVGEKVMQSETRERILKRTRDILKRNVGILDSWLADRTKLFSWRRPQAGGVAFLRYHLPMGSTDLVTKLREEESVFVVAGEWFGIDGHIRIGTGGEPNALCEALNRMDRFFDRQLRS
jgi:hypothetical protein